MKKLLALMLILALAAGLTACSAAGYVPVSAPDLRENTAGSVPAPDPALPEPAAAPPFREIDGVFCLVETPEAQAARAFFYCPTCEGEGRVSGGGVTCPICNGTGWQYIPNLYYDPYQGWTGGNVGCGGCGGCGGSGWSRQPNTSRCPTCHGTGIR